MKNAKFFSISVIAVIVLGMAGIIYRLNKTEVSRSLTVLKTEIAAPDPTAVNKSQKESEEHEFMAALNEIDRNLDIIYSKQGIILRSSEKAEDRTSKKESILQNIQMINSLLDENKEKIDKLQAGLKNSKIKNIRIEKLADLANAKIDQYEKDISNLKELLSAREFEYAEINKKMGETELKTEIYHALAAKYEKDLNTAYMTCGSYKKLKKEGVLEREGGLFGIGGTESLNKDFNQGNFSEIDIRTMRSVPLNNKKATLVTVHPSDSYEFREAKGTITSLEIKDPEKFWKASKYMVLAVK